MAGGLTNNARLRSSGSTCGSKRSGSVNGSSRSEFRTGRPRYLAMIARQHDVLPPSRLEQCAECASIAAIIEVTAGATIIIATRCE